MFYSLYGTLRHKELGLAVVECAGVGYKCLTTLSTLSRLPERGETVFLYTHLHLREDVAELYGFFDQAELNCFRQLLSVSGVGPKVALAILSDLTPEKVALCVLSSDEKTLATAQGVGKKLAARLILELKDKMGVPSLSGTPGSPAPSFSVGGSNAAEAIGALVVLGYSQSEAALAVGRLEDSLSVEELIRQALKAMAARS